MDNFHCTVYPALCEPKDGKRLIDIQSLGYDAMNELKMNSKEISKAHLTSKVAGLAFVSSPASFLFSYFLLSLLRRRGGGLLSMSP